jgi:hypothetical protein
MQKFSARGSVISSRYESGKRDDDASAADRDEYAAERDRACQYAEKSRYKASDRRSDYADDDIAQDRASASHNRAGYPADKRADRYADYYIPKHFAIPLLFLCGIIIRFLFYSHSIQNITNHLIMTR